MGKLIILGIKTPAHGQAVIWLIIFCSVLIIGIIIERLINLRRSRIKIRAFMEELSPLLKRNKIIEAVSACDREASPLANVIKAGILKHDRDSGEIKEVMEEAGMREIPRMEKNLPILATVAYLSPLLGMLGTILGMVEIFIRVRSASGLFDPRELAGGVGEALLTTALGIIVAIPAFIAHNYFVSRLDVFVRELRQLSVDVPKLLKSDSRYED